MSAILVTAIFILTLDNNRRLAFAAVCPQGCVCLDSTSLVVSCEGSGLSELPVDLSPTVTSLDMTRNHLKFLRPTTLGARPKLVDLKLKENGLEEIAAGAFRGLTSLRVLDLSENDLTVVDRTTFGDLSTLHHLDLSSNQLTEVDGAFFALRQLSRLDLRQNRLTAVANSTFAGAAALRYLRLDDNRVRHVDGQGFLDLNRLMYFVLKGNPIGTIGRISFGSEFLSYVDLSECELVRVPRAMPASVRYLQLRRNRLRSLSHKSFETCSNVTILVLDENGLEEIKPGTLDPMGHLQQLWLNGNRLRSVPRPIPKSVQRLFMDLNSVESLSEDDFPASSQLNTLSLMGNNISVVPANAFGRLALLKHLDLSGNRIVTLEGDTFLGNPLLQLLQLSKNSLNDLKSGCFDGLRELHTLSIAFVSSTSPSIDDDLFKDLTNLRKLHLDSSPGLIRTIVTSKTLLSSLSSLQDLNLDNSELETLRPDFPESLPNLAVLRLSSSRWRCDHALVWFRDWLLLKPVHVEAPERNKCHSPESMRDRIIVTLAKSDFTAAAAAAATLRPANGISDYPENNPSSKNNDGQTPLEYNRTSFGDRIPNSYGREDAQQRPPDSSVPRPERKTEKTVESSGRKDNRLEVLSWDDLKDRLSEVDDSYYREDAEPNDGRKQGRESPERKFERGRISRNISSEFEDKIFPVDPTAFLPSGAPRLANEDLIRIAAIAATIVATLLVGAVIVFCIVNISRSKNAKNSAVKSPPSDTRIGLDDLSSPTGEGRGAIRTAAAAAAVAVAGREMTVMATNNDGEIVMSLVPGRDINHEGPLRVYKWENF